MPSNVALRSDELVEERARALEIWMSTQSTMITAPESAKFSYDYGKMGIRMV